MWSAVAGDTEAKPAFKARMDECPFPTLADAYEISTRLYTVTIRRAFVRYTERTLCGSESNRLVLPSHCQIGISPPEGRARLSLTSTTFSS